MKIRELLNNAEPIWKFAAQNYDGSWWFYESKPIIGTFKEFPYHDDYWSCSVGECMPVSHLYNIDEIIDKDKWDGTLIVRDGIIMHRYFSLKENKYVPEEYENQFAIKANGDLYKISFGKEKFLSSKDYLVEHGTGVSDKNNNYLYQNDIVKAPNGNVSVIRWINGKFVLVSEEDHLGEFFGLNDFLRIGNVHFKTNLNGL